MSASRLARWSSSACEHLRLHRTRGVGGGGHRVASVADTGKEVGTQDAAPLWIAGYLPSQRVVSSVSEINLSISRK